MSNKPVKTIHPPFGNQDYRCDLEESISAIVASISEQFEIGMGQPDRVSQDCSLLQKLLQDIPPAAALGYLDRLLPLLQKRTGEIVRPLFSLMETQLAAAENKWILLKGMLSGQDAELISRTLQLVSACIESGELTIDEAVLRDMAELADVEDSAISRIECLTLVGSIIRHFRSHGETDNPDPAVNLFERSDEILVRRLAARILDLANEPIPAERVQRVLGEEACRFLQPYLIYSRVEHIDLLYLAPCPGTPPAALESLQRVEARFGKDILRSIISELGWPRICLGLEVQQYVGISIGGSLPLFVSPAEATLFKGYDDVRTTAEPILVIAHGGMLSQRDGRAGLDDPVTRFRSYNLTHAKLLSEILDIAPLTREKISAILQLMDCIVEDFIALFRSHTEECLILPDIYRKLKTQITAELDDLSNHRPSSPELTRLVQMFEDPRSIGQVHTLHGLKRFLHQRGLRLGFRLVEAGRAPNCTVDIALVADFRVVHTVRKIRYTDFDRGSEGSELIANIPYSVSAVADGFARQLLYGHHDYPRVDIFCYGNEVHYYLAYRNHPAFLRIDYAPPLQGGMIDLEYTGVSNYELSAHPNLDLDAIRTFFEKLEFDIDITGTRIHARYDKERVLNLGDLCRKAESVFRLVPYFMDVDWIIGSLHLDAAARRKVADAWAASFGLWGVLPIRHLLTEDHLGIIEQIETDSSGRREFVWSGEGSYRDRFSNPPPTEFFKKLSSTLESYGLDTLPILEEDCYRPMGQIRLEQRLFRPLQDALARGELIDGVHGIIRQSEQLFQREHEAEKFAEIMAAGPETTAHAVALARLITPLERMLEFQTTGHIGDNIVQRTRLPLRGDRLGLYVMRGPKGIIRLALFAQGAVLCKRRNSISDDWTSNGSWDVDELKRILFAANYMARGQEPSLQGVLEEAQQLLENSNPRLALRRPGRLPGQRLINGLKASRGRAVGRVIFGMSGRLPEDFDDAILVASSVRPEDSAYLYHAAGIVSTGGGILSHAGLIATQFHKPALIISGRWQTLKGGSQSLLFLTQEYRETEREEFGYQVCLRQEIRDREYRLDEGDLVVMDVDEGTLFVLGQNHDTLALHDGFRELASVYEHLKVTESDREILALRGRRLRAHHLIAKILSRVTDPILARHAVHELLMGEELSVQPGARDDRIGLLRLLIANPQVKKTALEYLSWITQMLENRCRGLVHKACRRIPISNYMFEIISLRLEIIRLKRAWDGALAILKECGFAPLEPDDLSTFNVDALAYKRLMQLRAEQSRTIHTSSSAAKDNTILRHFLRRVERIDRLLRTSQDERAPLDALQHELSNDGSAAFEKAASRTVLAPRECGYELASLIGWKAANLGEIERIGGNNSAPAWFVVTDYAFSSVYHAPLMQLGPKISECSDTGGTLRDAVESIIARPDVPDKDKSAQIRTIWQSITLPPELVHKVMNSYREINRLLPNRDSPDGSEPAPMVALRSSTCEEDAENAARAGEFETYLFISGEQNVIEHLKRTWSSLWTERAIHNRSILGAGKAHIGGGVIIQRMIQSRVSGVLQTVNIAGGELNEIVINVGLGLGEGVVSGVVETDQITVSKEGDLQSGTLRFRYVTGNKQKQMVYNQQRGVGTVLVDTVSHQRLRPALEYIELCELVKTAVRLESIYGYPLDIEFAIEGSRLWILQVRPVAVFLSELDTTIESYPLSGQEPAVEYYREVRS